MCLLTAMPAAAATQIGQTGAPANTCANNDSLVQAGTAGPPGYAVPAGLGVITNWSFQGHAMTPGTGRMVVWRPTAVANQFTVVGKTAVESFAAGTVTTFPARIPVQPGDVLGMRMSPAGFCLVGGLPVGDVVRSNNVSEPEEGSTQTFPGLLAGFRVLVAASVEPDTDGDGFGDEAQDHCPAMPGPDDGCPINTISFGKLKRNKGKGTAVLTVAAPGPGTLALTGRGLVKQRPGRGLASARFTAKIVSAAGDLKLKAKSKGSKKRKLNRTGKVKVKANVTYTPTGGKPNTAAKRIKLVKRR
jgi:hypothetical protein